MTLICAGHAENIVCKYVSMCVLSSVQCIFTALVGPKSARQSCLAPARPFTHAHIPLNPLTHTFSLTQLHKLRYIQTPNADGEHRLAVTQRCKTGSVPARRMDDP